MNGDGLLSLKSRRPTVTVSPGAMSIISLGRTPPQDSLLQGLRMRSISHPFPSFLEELRCLANKLLAEKHLLFQKRVKCLRCQSCDVPVRGSRGTVPGPIGQSRQVKIGYGSAPGLVRFFVEESLHSSSPSSRRFRFKLQALGHMQSIKLVVVGDGAVG